MPETKSRYQLERQDYLNHFTMMVDTKSLNEQQTQPKPRRPITPGKLKRSNKSAATFTVYAPTVFATLRAALGISHEDFLMVRFLEISSARLHHARKKWLNTHFDPIYSLQHQRRTFSRHTCNTFPIRKEKTLSSSRKLLALTNWCSTKNYIASTFRMWYY
jgi:hypothetical protein